MTGVTGVVGSGGEVVMNGCDVRGLVAAVV